MKVPETTRMFAVVFCAIYGFFFLCTSSLYAFEVGLSEDRHCVNAESKTVFSIQLANVEFGQNDSIRIYGFLAVAGRIVARGDALVDPAKSVSAASLTLQIPAVKNSLIVPAELELIVRQNDAGTVIARGKEPIFIFHPDPFAGRRDVLEELPIRVFDPDGKVVEVFSDKNAPVPFREIFNRQQIASVGDGVLVIGVETMENEQIEKQLMKQAAAAAENGAMVLCMEFPRSMNILPGMTMADDDASAEVSAIKRIRLEKPGVVKSFDKRFDILHPPLETMRNNGWGWYEAEYSSGGRLIVTNIPLIQEWRNSPVPRYLFRELVMRASRSANLTKW